jgi:hypothetical protein
MQPRYQTLYSNWFLRPLSLTSAVQAGSDEAGAQIIRFVSGWVHGLLAGLVALALLARLSSGHGFADCRASPIAFQPSADVEAAMSVAPGLSCAIAARVGSAEVFTLAVDAAPRHGRAVPRGRTGVTYTPAAGFRGEDQFALALTGRDRFGVGTMIVRVKVTVR